jgi:hypothetical protein
MRGSLIQHATNSVIQFVQLAHEVSSKGSLMSLQSKLATVLIAAVAVMGLIALRAGITGSAAARMKDGSAKPAPAGSPPTPVLVELFTSEGCSSCPPADALLSRLGKTQPVPGADIIALEEHVDYWDRLGWKDPFSSEAATERQNEYDQTFAGGQAYTPQMIVDGHAKFVGSSDSDALRAISAASQAPKAAVQLSWEEGDTLAIHIGPLASAGKNVGGQLYLAVAENMLHSDVKHGENAGRALEHNGVVRQLLPIGKIEASPQGFSSSVAVHAAREWNRANLRAVVFVQDRGSNRVLAAAAIPFPKA